MESAMASSESSPRMVRLTTALLLVATFAAGSLTGAGMCRVLTSRRPPTPPPMMAPFEEVGLSPVQQTRTEEIFEKDRGEFESVFRETFPKMRAINDQIEREVREVLTPDQRIKLDQLKARRPLPPLPGSPPGHRPLQGRPGDWRMPPPGPLPSAAQ
jgi:Spy/CpxP family protein refolding chaperone